MLHDMEPEILPTPTACISTCNAKGLGHFAPFSTVLPPKQDVAELPSEYTSNTHFNGERR